MVMLVVHRTRLSVPGLSNHFKDPRVLRACMGAHIHVHMYWLYLRTYTQYSGYGGDWVQLIHQEGEEKATMMLDGKFFRAVDKNCWNLEERICEMDRTGEEGMGEGCVVHLRIY